MELRAVERPEKSVFRRLSVFAGGWSLEAPKPCVPAIGVNRETVLELVSGLVNKSLVLTEEHDGQTRYRFMVTLQEYARKQLMRTDRESAVDRAHAEFVLALAIESDAKLSAPNEKHVIRPIEAEYNNIRAALTWTSRNDIGWGWCSRPSWDDSGT